jgi:signal transduction histidine kinase
VPTDVPIRINLLMVRSFLFLLIGYIVSNLVSAQRAQRRQLAAANRKLVRYAVALEQLTVSRERNRLARELHDTLAHTLSGLAVQLEAIMTIWEGLPRRAEAMLERALSMTRKGLQETRRALQDLRAAPLEDVGLALAIRGLAEGLAARYGFELTLAIDEHLSDLAPEVEQCYYRVAQEALENAARHANASTVSLTLARNGDRVLLKVVDDGAGFEAADAEEGLGIKGMVERAELIGGELHVETQPGQGTTVRLASDARP